MAENEWSTAGAVAGGLGAAGGTGFISSLFGAFSPTIKKAKKASRSYQRAVRQAAVEGAIRSKAQFEDKSYRDEQEMDQALAARGLGANSSIPTEDKAYFARAKDRAIQGLDTDINLAVKGKKLLDYEIRAQRLNEYMGYVNQLLGVAGGTIAGGL